MVVQRYKGLGEMNPEQLWGTTMNPEKRTLLQVKIGDSVDTNEIFTILMGDEVELSREFISKQRTGCRECSIYSNGLRSERHRAPKATKFIWLCYYLSICVE